MGFLSFLKNLFGILSNFVNILNFFSSRNVVKRNKTTHYFKNYHKHLTIYKDGTGVLINEFDIVFNKEEKTTLKRGIDISDGKKNAEFPPLNTMKKEDISNRFTHYGFWVHSEDNIISSVKEKYWAEDDDDDADSENVLLKNNKKIMHWVFNFNYSRIKPYKTYRVVYVMSIPGMFPINNGVLNIDEIGDACLLSDFDTGNSSSIKISNKVENLRYTISFESGILLEREPKCLLKQCGQAKKSYHPKLTHTYNTIYDKYTCIVPKPKLGSIIKINWQFSDRR